MTVYVLYTGGTIGMHAGSDGSLVPGSLEALLHHVERQHGWQHTGPASSLFSPVHSDSADSADSVNSPGSANTEQIAVHWDSLPEPIDSAMIDACVWQQLHARICQHYHDYQGIVVLHGTDTLAYTAAALSFALGRLDKPVVCSGSQLPLAAGLHSDAPHNLATAVRLAAQPGFGELAIAFGDAVLRGNRARKVHTICRQGFASPNYPPLARLHHATLLFNNSYYFNCVPFAPRQAEFSNRVALLHMHPGLSIDWLCSQIADTRLQGLVLHAYGGGNLPRHPNLEKAIAQAMAQGRQLMCVTQCHTGGVHMHSYQSGNWLGRLGVLSGGDITPEAALTKMMWALANLPHQCIRAFLETNQLGEMTNA